MTKQEFLANVAKLYRVGNRADSEDDPQREEWTKHAMAGEACCAALDMMLVEMVRCGAITSEERQEFFDCV